MARLLRPLRPHHVNKSFHLLKLFSPPVDFKASLSSLLEIFCIFQAQANGGEQLVEISKRQAMSDGNQLGERRKNNLWVRPGPLPGLGCKPILKIASRRHKKGFSVFGPIPD